jgi:glucosamine--fructose-6-phosphate aminotransferase (isomerizing)
MCIGITNTVGSTIARMTDCGVHINAGVEIGVASTKAYTSQFIAITLFALMLAEDRKSCEEDVHRIIDDLRDLKDKIEKVLALNDQIAALAKELKEEKSLLIMGRGYQYATCVEGALKVKEISYMHSEGILAGELKHGPLALVDEHMPVMLIATKDESYSRTMNAINQVAARGGRPIVMCSEGDSDVRKFASGERILEMPVVCPQLQGILNIIPLQLLSYHLACERGANVDQPRNLAKSVTVQ